MPIRIRVLAVHATVKYKPPAGGPASITSCTDNFNCRLSSINRIKFTPKHFYLTQMTLDEQRIDHSPSETRLFSICVLYKNQIQKRKVRITNDRKFGHCIGKYMVCNHPSKWWCILDTRLKEFVKLRTPDPSARPRNPDDLGPDPRRPPSAGGVTGGR